MATVKIVKSKGAYTFACNLTTGEIQTPVVMVGWSIDISLIKGSVNGESVWSTSSPIVNGASFTSTIPSETVAGLSIGPYVLSIFLRNADQSIKLDQAIPAKVITRM